MSLKKKLDFRGTGDDFPTPDAGIYTVEILDVNEEESKNKNPMLAWTFEIIDEDSEFYGSRIWDRTVLTKNALWKLRNLLESTGFQFPEDNDKLADMELDFESFVGKTARVKTGTYEYNGETKAEVEEYLQGGGSASKKVTEEDIAASGKNASATPF